MRLQILKQRFIRNHGFGNAILERREIFLPTMPTNREFQPVIQRFQLPFALFDELIRGCEMDLEQTRYANYEELELYCYRVASVVGLLSVEIFGYRNPACRDYDRT